MKVIENKRMISALDIILSKEPLDESDAGYQKPEPPEPRAQRENKDSF